MQWWTDFMLWAQGVTIWFMELAQPYGAWALFAWAFAESSFFPIPPDPLLILLSVASFARDSFFPFLNDPLLVQFQAGAEVTRSLVCFWYALVCSVGSVLGGMLGYLIGLKGGRPLLERWFRGPKTRLVESYYRKYDVWAVGIAGFTPLPYKVFTISAGVFKLDFKRFVLASVLSRSARFFLVAAIMYFFGEAIWHVIEKRFDLLTLAFVILLIGGFLVIRTLGKRAARHHPTLPPGT